MKISQSQLKAGDIILIAKQANLVIGKVLSLTVSGSVKYSFFDKYKSKEITNDFYYDIDETHEHNKTAYIPKPYQPGFERFFWLLKREDD